MALHAGDSVVVKSGALDPDFGIDIKSRVFVKSLVVHATIRRRWPALHLEKILSQKAHKKW